MRLAMRGKYGEKKGNGGKKEEGPITVVLHVDMPCKVCAKKVEQYVKGLDGVKVAKGNSIKNRLTVVGKVDPEKLRERVESKTKKKVVLIFPLPKKDKEDGGDEEDTEREEFEEPVVSMDDLKSRLLCVRCRQTIRRKMLLARNPGLHRIAKQQDLVAYLKDGLGLLDSGKNLVTYLKNRLGGDKKDDDKKDGGGGGGAGGGACGDRKGNDADKKDDSGGSGKGNKEEPGNANARFRTRCQKYSGNQTCHVYRFRTRFKKYSGNQTCHVYKSSMLLGGVRS